MDKQYHIGIWDLTFYKVDQLGNPEVDENGRVIIYEAPDLDVSFIADDIDSNWLRRIKDD